MGYTFNMDNSVEKVVDKLPSVMTVDDLAKVCEEEGVTIRSVVGVLSDGLKSTLMRVHNSGIEDSGEPDNPTRHKYMVSAMEMLRMVKKEVAAPVAVEHHMAAGDIERLEAIARELVGLESRLKADPIQQGIVDADVITVRKE